MELAWLVYIIGMLNSITGLFIAISAAGAVLLFISLIGLITTNDDYYGKDSEGNFTPKTEKSWKFHVKNLKRALSIGIPSLIFVIMIPSEKTAYMMVGAYATQKIATDPRSVEVGGKVLTIINQKLDKFIEAGMEKTSKKVDKVINKAVDSAVSKVTDDKK